MTPTQFAPSHPVPQSPLPDTSKVKLYTINAITAATFLGGPLAAGILVRRNYLNIGMESEGQKAIVFGIVATFLLFFGIFMIPDPIIDKIPNIVIPAIYTIAITFIVHKLQGPLLAKHKEDGNEFYSQWRAVGIGLLCCVIILAVVLAPLFLFE